MRSRAPFDMATGRFTPVDVEKLAKKLNLRDEGSNRGAQGLPDKSAKIADSIEQNVESLIIDIASAARNELTEYLRHLFQLAVGGGVKDSHDLIDSEAKRTIRELFQQTRDSTNLLYPLKSDALKQKRYDQQFQEDNSLQRPAHYPEAHGFSVWLITFLFLLESGANAFLMSDAMETGWIGALVVMFFISIVNISSGFILGLRVLPQLNHKQVSNRMLALCLLILFSLWLIAWNLFIGHYRDSLVAFALSPNSGIDGALLGQEAVQRFFSEAMFLLEDFKSWLTFTVGVLIAIASAWKGYYWDDPYPGYGRLDRSSKAKDERYGRAFESAQNRLEALAQEGKNRIDEVVSTANAHVAEAARLADKADQLKSDFNSYILRLEGNVAYLLQIYRDANISERDPSTTPAYWGKRFQFSAEMKKPISFSKVPSIELGMPQRVAKEASREIHDYQLRCISVYKTIDILNDADVMGEKIEKDLKEKLDELSENNSVNLRLTET